MQTNMQASGRYFINLLFSGLKVCEGNIQVAQDLVPAINSRQILGAVLIDIQGIDVYSEFHQEVDAMQMTFGGGQVQGCVSELIAFVRVTTEGRGKDYLKWI